MPQDQSRYILVALSGQLFEGLASDNLLHFNLNAIYVQMPDNENIPRLIGTSLALYMVGISVSPFMASLFSDISISFIIAIAIFAVSLLYLLLFVDGPKPERQLKPDTADSRASTINRSNVKGLASSFQIHDSFRKVVRSIVSPLRSFRIRPIAIIPGISLLLYNTGQAFIFSAIMVHTTLKFGFSAKQNGLLISIAHATSATYLYIVLFAVPSISRLSRRKSRGLPPPLVTRHPRTSDALFALGSLTMQSVFLTFLGLATKPWEVYLHVCLFSVGLATPSFIKSYTVLYFPSCDGPRAIAALTMMETIGGLLAPVVLGGLQAARPGAGILFVASALMASTALVFGVGSLVEIVSRPRAEPSADRET